MKAVQTGPYRVIIAAAPWEYPPTSIGRGGWCVTEIDVRLERVSKLFADVAAVDDLSLDIAEGEFFSMLGPSGCGKTTTLRMIGGFEDPTRGTIYPGRARRHRRPPVPA